MQEIPMSHIKWSQLLSIVAVAAALILQMPILLIALWLIFTVSFLFGAKANLLIQIGKLFAPKRGDGPTQSAELYRFNNAIAVMLLCLSTASFIVGWSVAGYVIAAILALAQLAALAGFCLGCFFYYQLKQRKAKFKS